MTVANIQRLQEWSKSQKASECFHVLKLVISLGPWLYCDRSFNRRVYLNWKTVETELIANWPRKFHTILTWRYSEPQMQRIGLDIGQTSRWRIKIEGKTYFNQILLILINIENILFSLFDNRRFGIIKMQLALSFRTKLTEIIRHLPTQCVIK